MNELHVQDLKRADVPPAAAVIAQALADNPTHRTVHGDDRQRRVRNLERMSRLLLRSRSVPALAAYGGDTVIGVLSVAPPHAPSPSAIEQLRTLPALAPLGFGAIARLARYNADWTRQAPQEAHWHLGPVAVAPAWQGHGAGRRLMDTFCARVDERGGVVYLETDKPGNVAFYEHFDFRTVAEVDLIGVPYWVMRRPGRGEGA